MILCLDVGNSHLYGGVFDEDALILQFRYPTTTPCTSDQLGIFFKSVLRENNLEVSAIKRIGISSVVPSLDYSIRASCLKYLSVEPLFLRAGLKTGLKLSYKNPLEIGADRIANAVAAIHQFPQKNILVMDLGTAITVDVISEDNNYQGGIIMPGIQLAMRSLTENTAKLPPVMIEKPLSIIGQSTVTNIQSGLFYGTLGALREMTQRISREIFQEKSLIIIGTGGFSHLFKEENLFTVIIPDLVLHGLKQVLAKNL